MIRKAVLVSNNDEDPSGVTFLFNRWDFSTKLPDFLFTFEPGADTTKVEILPEPAEPASAPATGPAK